MASVPPGRSTSPVFSVLGRLAVTKDGVDIPVPGRRERSVLAMLLAARTQAVPVQRFLDELWGEQAGSSAHGSLQVAISRLRSLLEPGRAARTAPELLVTSGSGYALLAPPHAVDSERFSAIVEGARAAADRGEVELSLRHCTDAAALWAEPPFGDLTDPPLVQIEARRLTELNLTSVELMAEGQLSLGRAGLPADVLGALVEAHPWRERLRALHALTLYRQGRQVEALDSLRNGRELLRNEFGLDLSPLLQQLEDDFLQQTPEVASLSLGVRPAEVRTHTATTAPQPRLVGRRSWLTKLTEAYESALAGDRRPVLVSGEPGIGKTALIDGFAAWARQQGARTVVGRCHEADVAPALWPWLPVVRDIAQGSPPALISDLLDPAAPSVVEGAAATPLRVYDAVTDLLVGEAERAPLVVIIEDLHWADVASLQLIAYAAQVLGSSRVMLVLTMRDVPDPAPAMVACLAELGRQSTVRISLPGLDASEARELVTASGDSIDEQLASVIVQRTEGNPFFILELVRLLSAEQRLDVEGAREIDVPHGVKDVLRRRLSALPAEVTDLLRVGAILGREFELDAVAEGAAVPSRDAMALLEQAVRARSLEDGSRPRRYRFTHALVRETLSGDLSLTRRGWINARVAVLLESRLAAEPDLVAEVAQHFLLGAAVDVQLAERAVVYACEAARVAERRGALDDALTHWEQARTAYALRRQGDPLQHFEVLVGLGRARYRRGHLLESRVALDEAVGLGRELGDVTLLARAVTSFHGPGAWYWREFDSVDEEMVALLEECAEQLPPGALRARVLSSLAVAVTFGWRHARAEATGVRAIEEARVVGDPDLLGDVVAMHTILLMGKPGSALGRIALIEEVLPRVRDLECELYLGYALAAARAEVGEFTEAGAAARRCIELVRLLGHRGADIALTWWKFQQAIAADDLEGARALAETNISRQTHNLLEVRPLVEIRLAGAGAPVPEEFVELARNHPYPPFRAVVSHALAEAGEVDEAIELLGEPTPDGAWSYASMLGDCLSVDVLARRGPSRELQRALQRIVPYRDEFANYGAGELSGSIEYFVGRGLEGLGDVEGARAAYEKAVDRNRSAGILPWLRRAQAQLIQLSAGTPTDS